MAIRIKWFKEISKEDVPSVGGKGANLGEMYNNNIPIPPGYVVLADTFKEFIEKTKIKSKIFEILNTVNVDDSKDLQKKANQIQALIIDTDVPREISQEIIENYKLVGNGNEFVAVRSSATAEDLAEASFAGQQATFLNVRGIDKIVNAVRACWASLYTARAIYYRQKNNFPHEKVLIAVVVQKMVNSKISGIMFTANPVTNNYDEIMIEAIWGLGEMIVSGSANPNHYLVSKNNLKILDIKPQKQDTQMIKNQDGENEIINVPLELQNRQTLTDKQILECAEIGKKIDDHYGKPMDIEWAIEIEHVEIVQARPITTIKPVSEKETNVRVASSKASSIDATKAKVIISGLTASPGCASGRVKILKDAEEIDRILKGDILVTKMTNPDMVPAMERAAAIVTDEGGMTCHAAIVSREMGIPCIVGTEKATSVIKEGQMITVDASHAVVYDGAIEIEHADEPKVVVQQGIGATIETATKVKVICDLPQIAEKAAATGADGVGLVRIEFMIANAGKHPAKYIKENKDDEYTQMLAEGIGGIAKAFAGKPVWVRTSDIRTDEYRNLKGGNEEPTETDPMIGWHAIRRGLDEPRILKAEFKAIKVLYDQGIRNIGIMLPFIIRTEEVIQAKKILREVGLEPRRDIAFGIMVETPAVCWIMDEMCKEGIDFVSFGTNDLTQLTLGLDRNNQRIAKLFDEMHPAVLSEIAQVIEICRRYNVQTSICGQAGSRPEMAKFLVECGATSISANIDAVPAIRKMVYETERNLLLELARERKKFM